MNHRERMWAIAVSLIMAGAAWAAELQVGNLGDPSLLRFEGCGQIGAERVRRALICDPQTQLASCPSASRSYYLETLEQQLLGGYRDTGFPDAKVRCQVAPDGGSILVSVTEGSRFMAGKILVVGEGIDQQAVCDALEKPDAKTVGCIFGGKSGSLTLEYGPRQTVDKPRWVPGEPASFLDSELPKLERDAVSQLHQQGFLWAEANAELLRHDKVVDLKITVAPGPQATITSIRVTGLKRHTPEQLLTHLQLSQPMSWNQRRLRGAIQGMWDSGRFLTHKMTLTAGRSSRGDAAMLIACDEASHSPLLDAPLSATQEALLRAAHAATELATSQDDLVLQIRMSDAPEVSATMSFAEGACLDVGRFQVRDVRLPPLHFLVTRKLLGIVCDDGPAYLAPCAVPSATVLLTCMGQAESEGQMLLLNLGAFASGSGATGSNPLRAVVACAPVCCLEMGEGWTQKIKDHTLSVSKGSTILTANADTGRLLQLESEQMTARFDPGLLAARVGELTKAVGSRNQYDAQHPVSSFAGFLIDAVIHERVVGAKLDSEQAVAAGRAARKLLTCGALNSVRLASTGDKDFTPIRTQAPENLMASIAAIAIPTIDSLFERESWPWTLSRETCMAKAGFTRYTQLELFRLTNSGRMGPLGMSACAVMMGRRDARLSRQLISQARQKLSPDEIVKDCHELLGRDAQMPLGKLVRGLAQLTPQEIDALTQLLPSAQRQAVVHLWEKMREGKTAPAEALAAVIQESGTAEMLLDYAETSMKR